MEKIKDKALYLKKFKHINLDRFKSISIWALFSIALIRGLGFTNMNIFVYYLILPGIIFYLFLIYFLLKTNTFMKYWNFLFSILIIAFVFHLANFIIVKYIQLAHSQDDLLRILAFFSVNIIIASFLYLLSYLIKSISKA